MKIPPSLRAVSLLVPTASTFSPNRLRGLSSAEVEVTNPDPLQQYYLRGYAQPAFADDTSHQRLMEVLRDLRKGRLKDGFQWKEKYSGTSDLRPDVLNYDSIFLDMLFANDIPALMRRVIGYDLVLGHIQLRKVEPGTSYMDWHRDTHFYGGKLAGNLPPVHKIIFYPSFEESSTPTLLVCPGSHRRMFSSKLRDILQIRQYGSQVVKTSNTQFLLFDTSLLHAVIPHTHARGAFRLMYSFYHRFQLKQYEQFRPVYEAYERRL